ncbi:CCAAT/enhancer-binding protein gamma [Vulpes lagopus]
MSKRAQQDGTAGICIIHTQAPASGLQQVANWVLLALGVEAHPRFQASKAKRVWTANSGLPMDHNSDEHRQGRERNDMAVKKEPVEKQAEGTGCIAKSESAQRRE